VIFLSSATSNILSQAHNSGAEASLVLDSVSCERGERMLVNALSLTLSGGQGMRIEGPNGSGKTTLLRVLAGLSQQYSGRVSWCGQDIRNDRAALAADTLYIGHLAGVKALLSPLENLSWWLSLHISAAEPITLDKMLTALNRVGLKRFAHTPCHQLSAGQQRRIALARLYLSEHRLWILDEPFTAIDASGVTELEQCIAGHLAQGRMAIVTTHQAMNIAGFSSCSLHSSTPVIEADE